MNEESKNKSLQQLLVEFSAIRKENLKWFTVLQLTGNDLDKTGIRRVLGAVT